MCSITRELATRGAYTHTPWEAWHNKQGDSERNQRIQILKEERNGRGIFHPLFFEKGKNIPHHVWNQNSGWGEIISNLYSISARLRAGTSSTMWHNNISVCPTCLHTSIYLAFFFSFSRVASSFSGLARFCLTWSFPVSFENRNALRLAFMHLPVANSNSSQFFFMPMFFLVSLLCTLLSILPLISSFASSLPVSCAQHLWRWSSFSHSHPQGTICSPARKCPTHVQWSVFSSFLVCFSVMLLMLI